MPFTPSQETKQRRETVRKLYLEDGLTPKQIHEATGIPMHQIYRDLKALGKTVMEPIKNAVQQQIKDEQAIQEIEDAVKDSLQRRKKCLQVLEGIRDREPAKIKTEKGEITIDEAPLKLRTTLAINELQNSLDELLGIRDVATIKEVMRQREEIAGLRKLIEGRPSGNSKPQ
jgi:hypothetical protein